MKPLRIATRASRLALWQAEWVAAKLRATHPGLEVELHHVSTRGDRIQDRALSAIGATGLFTKELERTLLGREADIAVHSLKDMETTLPDGLLLGAVPERASPYDVLVTSRGTSLEELQPGAVIGTSALRRRAQLAAARPDLRCTELRGNVPTRLAALAKRPDLDGIVLADAGLRRLELLPDRHEVLPPAVVVPAVGQGALGIEARASDDPVLECVRAIDDPETHAAADCERAFLAALGGGCALPAGALAVSCGGELTIGGVLCSADGTTVIRAEASGSIEAPGALGRQVAQSIVDQGGERVLAALRATRAHADD